MTGVNPEKMGLGAAGNVERPANDRVTAKKQPLMYVALGCRWGKVP